MSYDPAWPQNGQNIDADRFRDQFGGLKDISDALAATNITAVVVDAVNTVAAGQPAAVTVNVIGNMLHLTFDIPQGTAGSNGTDGGPGGPGPQGDPGPPGEVTTAAFLAGSSANTNGVGTLGLSASPTYDASQLQNVAIKLDELINALRR